MKAPKKWYLWLLMVVCGGYLLASLLLPNNESKPTVNTTTNPVIEGHFDTVYGNTPQNIRGNGNTVVGATDSRGNTIITQSMAVGFNAHAGPGSIAIGANANAGNITQTAGRDINNGVSDATLQKVLNLKDVELSERMLSDYPHGCIILGLKNGKVIYDSRLKDIQINGDWDNAKFVIDTNSQIAFLLLPHFSWISAQGGMVSLNYCSLGFRYAEDQPMQFRNMPSLNMFTEVLDKNRGIFLIGFK